MEEEELSFPIFWEGREEPKRRQEEEILMARSLRSKARRLRLSRSRSGM